MSLRRTALARKTELRRGAPMARGKGMRAQAARATRPDTGPTPAQRNLVVERAAGCCELCGLLLHDGYEWVQPHSFHHRRPRRAGGSRLASTNAPSNILLLCGTGTTRCHGRVEADRAAALRHGWLLHAGQHPPDVPVDIGPFHVAVRLTDAGDYEEIAA